MSKEEIYYWLESIEATEKAKNKSRLARYEDGQRYEAIKHIKEIVDVYYEKDQHYKYMLLMARFYFLTCLFVLVIKFFS